MKYTINNQNQYIFLISRNIYIYIYQRNSVVCPSVCCCRCCCCCCCCCFFFGGGFCCCFIPHCGKSTGGSPQDNCPSEELNIFTLLKQRHLHYWLLETAEHLVWFHFTKFQLNTSSISLTVRKHLNNFSQRPLNAGCICISKKHKVLKFKNGLQILLSFSLFEQMPKLFSPS